MDKHKATKKLCDLCETRDETDEMLQEMRSLIDEHHADVNSRDVMGRAPLHNAVRDGKIKSCRLLVEKGADINDGGEPNYSPLHLACRKERLETVRTLLGLGANVNVRNCSKRTPLHKAAQYGGEEVCQLLIDHGADINARDRWLCTPLHFVTSCPQTCQLLLQRGAEIDAQDHEGVTPLLLAVSNQHWDVARVLLEAGANPDISDSRSGGGYHKPSECRFVQDFLGRGKQPVKTPPARAAAAPLPDVAVDDSPHVQQLKNARAKLRGFERPESDDLGRTPGGGR